MRGAGDSFSLSTKSTNDTKAEVFVLFVTFVDKKREQEQEQDNQ